MPQRKVSFILPTTYENGETIPADKAAKLVTHVYVDDVEVGASVPGASQWVGDVPQEQGQSLTFSCRCEVDGVADDLSPESAEVVFALPFLQTSPPTGLSIS